ncbi:hypothetical protein POM88_008302 [Heracleum sosnowskyi]|uniref:DDE Tnp4 domain-containing protein n=1 Tax=Heracleum sosnowskyi TaxID=360622 RepID=A0AAD8J6E6_9APIA|nr:hypothetical protein POM88_008302 [Heracleum sosnowskyi]
MGNIYLIKNFLQNCLGALDGTHIKVRVGDKDKVRFRNRKGELTTNVLAACTRDMQFTYILPGWEGSTHDNRVLRDDVEAQQVHDLTTEDEITPNKQSCQRETQPSTAPSTNRTTKARTETIEVLKDFSSKIEKISGVMETVSEHKGRLVSCFQHESESDSAERRMQVTTEVMKIGQLTHTQVLLASKKIALNPLEVDFFFSLPGDYKYAYVQGLLIPEE